MVDNRLEEFHSLVSAKSKIKKADAEKAAIVLYEWFADTKDIKTLCAELLDAYQLVMEKFAAQYLATMSNTDLSEFTSELVQQLKSIKLSKTTLSCGFVLVAGAHNVNMLNSDMLCVLKTVVERAEQKGAFSDARGKDLRKNLIDATGATFLEADYSSWEQTELLRMDAYLSVALPDLESVSYRERVYKWRVSYGIATQPIATPIVAAAPNVAPAGNVLYAITPEMVAELKTLYENAFVKNNAFRDLEDAISQKEQLLQSLQSSTQELSERNMQLTAQIAEKEEQVRDLDERLTNIFKLDTIAMNQELITLKNNLKSALKLTHDDYKALLEIPLSSDSYELAKVIIEDMFKILKRHGIEL